MQNQAVTDQENNNKKIIQEIYDDCKQKYLASYKKMIDYCLSIRAKILDEQYQWTEDELETLLNRDNLVASSAAEDWQWKYVKPYWEINLNLIRDMLKNKISITPEIYEELYLKFKLQKRAQHFNRLICTLFPGQLLFIPADTELSKIKISGITDTDNFSKQSWIYKNISLFKYCFNHIEDSDNNKAFFISCFAWNLRDSLTKTEELIKITNSNTNLKRKHSFNCIFYGAPGTGKSHAIKKLTEGKNVIRTTFHPDSDYSTFVGCYKPTTKPVPMRDVTGKVIRENGKDVTEDRIIYKFVPQSFLKAYLGAWKKYAEATGNNIAPQYLVIEEINRGNCAQIFGDLFQLLDRQDDNGFSEYPIEADTDLQQEIERAFKEEFKLEKDINVEGIIKDYTSNHGATLSEDIQAGRVLLLPNNLYIWATMNTSDQSLFPIDSAFKRRWEWEYVPIHNCNKGWRIAVNNDEYDWWDFLEKINEQIGSTTNSEDKKLGYFFCKADNDGIISAEKFVSKVIFYLWNDVFKDFGFDNDIFKDEDGKELSFNKFYTTDENGETKVVEEKVRKFLENLGLIPLTETNEDIEEDNESETKSTLVVTYNNKTYNDKASIQNYTDAISAICNDKGYQNIANILGADLVQNPTSAQIKSRNYVKLNNSSWYLAKRLGNKRKFELLSKLNEAFNLGLEVKSEPNNNN